LGRSRLVVFQAIAGRSILGVIVGCPCSTRLVKQPLGLWDCCITSLTVFDTSLSSKFACLFISVSCLSYYIYRVNHRVLVCNWVWFWPGYTLALILPASARTRRTCWPFSLTTAYSLTVFSCKRQSLSPCLLGLLLCAFSLLPV